MGSDDAYPVSVSSLHFPSAALSVSQTLSSLRRSALSIPNRLRSIEADARFVQDIAKYYGLPLVANERCGSWYLHPQDKAGSAYFKSTDGHAGQWNFSFRRLNLQILPVAQAHGGCIIVDSTRRGKLMPDALSKTIPIWCAVMNRALFPSESALHAVQFPPNYLGTSEESQIEKRIDGFVRLFKELKLDLNALKEGLGNPIRIAWANQTYVHPPNLQKGDGYNLFVLCSASRRVHGAEMSEGGYIQGAGDDSEAWAHDLTAPVFWEHKAALLATEESELPGVIEELMNEHRQSGTTRPAMPIHPPANLYISQSRDESDTPGDYDLIIACNEKPAESRQDPKKLCLGCGSSKIGSRDLRIALEKVKPFVEKQLLPNRSRTLLVTCETGKDLSVGVLLVIICLYYNDSGQLAGPSTEHAIDKQFIRQRLAWIVTSNHDANPSGATLQSVNAFLLHRPN